MTENLEEVQNFEQAKGIALERLKEFLPDDEAEIALSIATKLLDFPRTHAIAIATYALDIIGSSILRSEGQDVNSLPVELRNLFYYNELCHNFAMQAVATKDGRPIIEKLKQAAALEAQQEAQEEAQEEAQQEAQEEGQPSIILQ